MKADSNKVILLILAPLMLITIFSGTSQAQCTINCTPLTETFGTTAGCAATTVQSSSAYPGIVNMTNQTYSGGNNNTDAPGDGYYAVRCNNTNGWNGQWYDLTKGMTDADGVAGGNYLVVNGGAESFGSTATGYNPYEFYHKTVTNVCPGSVYTISFKAGNLSTYNSGNSNSCSYGGIAEIQLYAMPGGTAVQPTVVAGTPTPYNGSAGTQLLVTGTGTGGTGLGMTCSSTGFVWNTYSYNYTIPAGQTSIDVVLLSSYLKAGGNDFAVDDIKVTWLNGGVLGNRAGDGCTNPTPVKLISFTAEKASQNVILRWSTASEKNNNYFAIERSTDGVHFEQIGTVKGKGISNETNYYTFNDYSFHDGSVYYRLKQVDFDNKYEYSPITYVNIDVTDPVIITNDPSSSQALISFYKKGEATFTIIDMVGREVYSGKRVLDEPSIIINKSMLCCGFYIVKVQIGSELVSRKIILN